MRNFFTKIKSSTWLLICLSVILGALIVLVIRFATYHNPKGVHYHANFAMYINGQKEEFKDGFYYEEIGSGCNTTGIMDPHDRVHMHDHINSVIHVHDNAVTWGDFFQNIGWVVDNNLIETAQGKIYLADSNNKVTFVLNGKTTDNVINQVIGDEDRLLVNYGDQTSKDISDEYQSVPTTAHKYDISKDPKSCGGGAKPTTTSDRFKHLF